MVRGLGFIGFRQRARVSQWFSGWAGLGNAKCLTPRPSNPNDVDP